LAVEHQGARRGSIFLVILSKRCEPSAHLFTRAVKFFLVNGYGLAKDIGASEIILVNTCCVTQDKLYTAQKVIAYHRIS
jgi:hypothetical protein